MKVVLFCGGLGTRIRDYAENIPKPMVPIGHQPILWHVMQYYRRYGHQRFHPLPRIQSKRDQGVFSELQTNDEQRLHHFEFRHRKSKFWANSRRIGALRSLTQGSGAISANGLWR